MNKKTVLTSLTAAALAGVFLTGANVSENVKAAVKPNGETAKAKTAEENAQDNVNSAQKEVDNAQQNVNSAKSNLDSAQSNAEGPDAAYSAQKAKTDAAQKDEADKKATLGKANDAQKQAQQLVNDSKDPAKVKQANDDVTAKSSALDTAKKEQTAADKNVSDQDAQVKQAQNQVNDLTKTRDDKQKAKTAADQQVKNAEDALKGTGVTEAKNALDDATQKRSESENTLTKANTDVETSIKDVNKAQDALKQVQAKKTQADQDQQKAQKAANDADSQANIANGNLQAKQNEINDLTTKLNRLQDLSKNNIDLVDINKFKQAYADYLADGKLTADDIKYADAAGAKNQYISSEADKKEMVDVNNIKPDQLKELALFTSDLLTKVRSQLGLGGDNTQVTQGSIDFAEKVAQKYVTDYNNGSWTPGWHDATGINELSKENGLDFNAGSDSDEWQYYEDMAGAYIFSNPISMDELKENIYDQLVGMIIPNGNGIDQPGETSGTYEMSHTRGLLGLPSVDATSLEEYKKDLDNEVKNASQELLDPTVTVTHTINGKTYSSKEYIDYLKTQIAKIDNQITKLNNHQYYINKDDIDPMQYIGTSYSLAGEPNIHFININPSYVTDSKKFNTQNIPSYVDQINEVHTQITTKNSELATLQKVADTANALKRKKDGELERANGYVDAANKAVKSAEDALTQDNAKLTSDQQKAQDAQTAFNEANNKFNQAKNRYDVLTASQDQKVKDFNTAVTNQKSAENALTEAQSNLDKATNALNTAKDKLENLQTVAKTKAEAVKKVQDELTVAQKRVEDLKNAPQILAQANDAQAKAQKEYDAAKKAADEAQAQLNKLESAKSTADAQVSTAQAEYDTALANLKAAEDKLANAKKALEQIKQSEALLDQTSTTSTESSSEFKRIRLTHNAYVYTKAFKVVKYKNHKNIVLKKGHYIKAWNKGKIVTIKGKKFYQIGKNRFVKVANTINKRAEKNYVLATVKGRKNHKARVYLANGKFAKKYVYGQKTYKLAEKKIIKGKTYYRIYGKKLWVRASDLNLQK